MRCLVVCATLSGPGWCKEKSPAVYKILSPPKPDFSQFGWLVGEWSGKVGPKEPIGDAHFSAAYDLDQRLMIFREELSFDATKNAPAYKDSWMGILSPRAGSKTWSLRIYTSHGLITRYEVTANGSEIHFNSEGGDAPPPGWLFRRVIQRVNDVNFIDTVQVAPPNRDFFDYYSARFTRVVKRPVTTRRCFGSEALSSALLSKTQRRLSPACGPGPSRCKHRAARAGNGKALGIESTKRKWFGYEVCARMDSRCGQFDES